MFLNPAEIRKILQAAINAWEQSEREYTSVPKNAQVIQQMTDRALELFTLELKKMGLA